MVKAVRVDRGRWRAHLGVLSAHGRTKTEAANNVINSAEWALSGDYIPYVIRFRSYIAILWREPTGPEDGGGWHYKILAPEEPGSAACMRLLSSVVYAGSFVAAIKGAVLALAQQSWCPEDNDNDDEFTQLFRSALNQDDAEKALVDFRDWTSWQRRYRAAREQGTNPEEAWEVATGLR